MYCLILGSVAALTNNRQLPLNTNQHLSRGDLVLEALQADNLEGFAEKALLSDYPNFNLIVGNIFEPDGFVHITSPPGHLKTVETGGQTFSIANGPQPWPKCYHGSQIFQECLEGSPDQDELARRLLERLLADKTRFPIDQMPLDTCLSRDQEMQLSAIFVEPTILHEGGGLIGTRSSSVIIVDQSDYCHFYEVDRQDETKRYRKMQLRRK